MINPNHNAFRIFDFVHDIDFNAYGLNLAAKKIGVAEGTVKSWVKKGKISFIKYKDRALIPEWTIMIEQKKKESKAKRVMVDQIIAKFPFIEKEFIHLKHDMLWFDLEKANGAREARLVDFTENFSELFKKYRKGRFEKVATIERNQKYTKVREYLENQEFQIIAETLQEGQRKVHGQISYPNCKLHMKNSLKKESNWKEFQKLLRDSDCNLITLIRNYCRSSRLLPPDKEIIEEEKWIKIRKLFIKTKTPRNIFIQVFPNYHFPAKSKYSIPTIIQQILKANSYEEADLDTFLETLSMHIKSDMYIFISPLKNYHS